MDFFAKSLNGKLFHKFRDIIVGYKKHWYIEWKGFFTQGLCWINVEKFKNTKQEKEIGRKYKHWGNDRPTYTKVGRCKHNITKGNNMRNIRPSC